MPRRSHEYFVYIMTNRSHTSLYTGITNDLVRRRYEHKNRRFSSFTARYNIDWLLHYESFRYVDQAIAREKEIKGWRREKKEALIREHNPRWVNLTGLVLEEESGDEIPRRLGMTKSELEWSDTGNRGDRGHACDDREST